MSLNIKIRMRKIFLLSNSFQKNVFWLKHFPVTIAEAAICGFFAKTILKISRKTFSGSVTSPATFSHKTLSSGYFFGNLWNFSDNYSQDQEEHAYCHSFKFLCNILGFTLFISRIAMLNAYRDIFRAKHLTCIFWQYFIALNPEAFHNTEKYLNWAFCKKVTYSSIDYFW